MKIGRSVQLYNALGAKAFHELRNEERAIKEKQDEKHDHDIDTVQNKNMSVAAADNICIIKQYGHDKAIQIFKQRMADKLEIKIKELEEKEMEQKKAKERKEVLKKTEPKGIMKDIFDK